IRLPFTASRKRTLSAYRGRLHTCRALCQSVCPVAFCYQRQDFFVCRIERLEGFTRFRSDHLPPISNCFGCRGKSSTALALTPCAAFSMDGTAAAISLTSEV